MKKFLLILMIGFGICAQGQNTVSIGGGSGHPGDTVTVTVSLSNSDAVTALQTAIPLGDNLAYVPGSATLTDRSNGHLLTATAMGGSLHIYSYSLALNTYTGNSGALLTFRVVLGLEPGNVSLAPTGTVLSSDTGTALAVTSSSGSVTVVAPKVQVTPTAIDYGHVPIRSSYTRSVTVKNIGNETLTLSGVTFSDSTIACQVPATLAAGAQQTVTVAYSPVKAGTTMMTATFHSNAKVGDSVLTINAAPYSVNELRPLNCVGYTDSIVTVELRMNNMDSIVGLQTAIKLPEALTYVAGSFAVDSNRSHGHTATAGLHGDTLTLLVTNLNNYPLHGADGVVARFALRLHGYGSYTLRLSGTALSDSEGNNVLSAVYTGTVNIYSPYLSIDGSLDLGNTPVTETAVAERLVRNTGNAPLVIDRAIFTQDHWHLLNELPIVIDNYGRDTLRVTYDGTAEGNHSAQLLLYTNDPRNDLKRINLTAQRYEPNRLYMDSEGDYRLGIMLDNYSDVTALQFDIQYPHRHYGLETSDIVLTERAEGHIVSAARQNDSTLRLLVVSMNNSPFAGNEGAVAELQFHPVDVAEQGNYPVILQDVATACTDGVNRLSSIDNIVYIATRTIHDSVYIHDTTIVHDTTYIDVHDTTVVTDTVTLTEYVPVHDTTYVDVHDTTYIDVFVHDTTVVTDTLTLTEYVPVHDTTYVDVYVHDTTIVVDTVTLTEFVPVHDTTYVNVHDTTYIDVFVHDTTVVTDTVTLTEYVPVHDTTIVTDTVTLTEYVPVHDTTIVTDTVTMTEYVPVHDTMIVTDTVTLTEYVPVHDTTIVTDTLTLTEYIPVHDTTYIDVHDTIYIDVPYPVYDTTVVTDTVTLTEYVPVHDTTYIDVFVHDTTVVTDTVTLTEYVPVHDTTIVTDTVTLTEYVPVHDTTIVTDTVTLTEYVPVHDTTYIDVFVHDTTTVIDTVTLTEYMTVYDTTVVTDTVTLTEYVHVHDTTIVNDTVTVDNYIYDTTIVVDTVTVDNFIYDTTIVVDTLRLTDTVYIYITDTVYVGVDEVEVLNVKMYVQGSEIVVENSDGNHVSIYDAVGRLIATKQDAFAPVRFPIATSGVYMVKVGDLPARKVVVVR